MEEFSRKNSHKNSHKNTAAIDYRVFSFYRRFSGSSISRTNTDPRKYIVAGVRITSSLLKDKLLNTCGELSATPIRDIEVFKLLVGGDTIMGEFKGKSPFFFQNKCRLLYAGNMLPPVKNEDYSRAFINRLVVLNFPTEIPKSEMERNLLKHLTEEADAIFFRAMVELKGLIDNNFSFVILPDSENILDDYAFQSLNIDVFVDEQCEKGNNCRVHTVTLYEAYKKFCRENAVTPISRALFSQKIDSLIGVRHGRFRMNGSNPMRGFEGIGLKGSAPDMDTDGESEDKASVADEREGGEI